MKRTLTAAVVLIAVVLLAVLPGAADDKNIALPAGTELHVRLTTTLSTKTNENGDPWEGRVVEPIFAEGREVVPAGSSVEGHVTYLQEPGRATGRGEMRLVAETIGTNEGTYIIVASLQNAQGAEGVKVKGDEGTIEGPGKDSKGTLKEAGIAAAGGAVVGTMVHGGSGALYGAAIGAMASAIHGVLKKHKGVVLPQGTEMTFVLSHNALAKQVRTPRAESPSP